MNGGGIRRGREILLEYGYQFKACYGPSGFWDTASRRQWPETTTARNGNRNGRERLSTAGLAAVDAPAMCSWLVLVLVYDRGANTWQKDQSQR